MREQAQEVPGLCRQPGQILVAIRYDFTVVSWSGMKIELQARCTFGNPHLNVRGLFSQSLEFAAQPFEFADVMGHR